MNLLIASTSLSRRMLLTSMGLLALSSASALAQQNRDWDHDREERFEHSERERHFDRNDHRRMPEVVVHIDERPEYRPRFVPEPVIVYHNRYRPYYYTSHYYNHRYIPVETTAPYVEVRCDNGPIMGTVVGGIAGGLIGNQFGGHRGRTTATIGGALLGALVGHSIDRADESCAYQALEYAQPNTQITWVNPEDNYSYTVTPGTVTNAGNGRYCREYQAKVLVGNQVQSGYGQACRQPDGSWEIVN